MTSVNQWKNLPRKFGIGTASQDETQVEVEELECYMENRGRAVFPLKVSIARVKDHRKDGSIGLRWMITKLFQVLVTCEISGMGKDETPI